VHLHNGVIEARNLQTGGLVVSVTLPILDRDASHVVTPEATAAA
jgi:hypothetical protein